MALVDMVMSVRGVPTTAAAVGATDTPLSSTTGKQGKYDLILQQHDILQTNPFGQASTI